MSRDELMENIRYTNNMVKRIFSIQQELHVLASPKIEIPLNTSFFKRILYWFASIVIFLLINSLLSTIASGAKESMGWIGGIISNLLVLVGLIMTLIFCCILLSVVLLLPIVYPRVAKTINKKLSEQKNKKNHEKLKQKRLELNSVFQEFIEITIIPKDYHNVNFLDKAYKYLQNMRADTLKECINLYETENRFQQDERNRERRHQQEMEQSKRQHAAANKLFEEQNRRLEGIHIEAHEMNKKRTY